MKKFPYICLLGAAAFIFPAGAQDDYLPSADYQTSYQAGTASAPRPASDYVDTFSGKVYAGYQSRYQYKNIVASKLLNSSGLFNIGGQVDMPLGTWQQHILADYGLACDGWLNDRNMFDVGWAADREILPNLRAGGGYMLNYGGLPGFVAKARGKAPHSLAQSLDGYLTYDDPGHGYFGTLDVQGGFYGLTGWRFDLQVGKRWQGLLHQYVDLELSGGIGLSTSYWGSGVDGIDQLNVKLAAPIRTSLNSDEKGFRITPFVQFVWAGNTRSDINRACGYRVIDRFEVVGGVMLSFKF